MYKVVVQIHRTNSWNKKNNEIKGVKLNHAKYIYFIDLIQSKYYSISD